MAPTMLVMMAMTPMNRVGVSDYVAGRTGIVDFAHRLGFGLPCDTQPGPLQFESLLLQALLLHALPLVGYRVVIPWRL